MTFMILIIGTIILSAILNLFEVGSTYNVVDTATKSYEQKMVTVESLLSLSGFKYIFSSTVSSFVAFTPLSMLIIILIGLGVMEKSNFLKISITLLTQNVKKQTVTFVIALLCILFSSINKLFMNFFEQEKKLYFVFLSRKEAIDTTILSPSGDFI